jgi:hypothetical protein
MDQKLLLNSTFGVRLFRVGLFGVEVFGNG